MDMKPLSFGAAHCNQFAILPPITDSDYLDRLLTVCLSHEIEVLIPGLDSELLLLARSREIFAQKGIKLAVAGSDLVALCRDKLRWGKELSVVSPLVLPSYSPEEALMRLSSGELSLPLIAKPLGGSASAGIEIIHSADQLSLIGKGYVVQPFVLPLPTDHLFEEIKQAADEGKVVQAAEISIQSVYSYNGTLLGRMASCNRLKNGAPIEVVPISLHQHEAAIDALESKLRAFGLRGPINLQGRLTDKGLRLFEMNPRFTGISGLRARLGFNEVEAVIRDMLNLPQLEGGLTVNSQKVGVRQIADQVVKPSRTKQLSGLSSPLGGASHVGQNVLVTGATGWLARQLVVKLVDDPRVASLTLLTRNPEQLRAQLPRTSKCLFIVQQGSSTDRPALPAGKIDLLYHLASGRPIDSLESQADSLRATATLFDHLAENGLQSLVNISSQSVYGLKRLPPWFEELSAAPESPYAMAKWASELLAQSLSKASPSSRVTSLRLARLYGAAPGLRWSELPHLFAQKAAAGQEITIKGGQQQFDLIHIQDAVAALVSLLDDQKDWQHVYNLGGSSLCSIHDIATAAVESAHTLGLKKSEIKIGEGHDSLQFGMNCTRFQNDFRWMPETSLNQAMLDLLKLAINRK